MATAEKRPVVLIAGPTASGKSAVASTLAQRCRGTVINADAMQVYRELRILTARPTPEDEASLPHRLFGAVSAGQAWSTGLWLEAARTEIEAAWSDGRVPVVVGGTGLYFRALESGLASVPPVPLEVRAFWRKRLAAEGAPVLHGVLRERCPDEATRLGAGDSQRLARALEVLEATGKPLSYWQGRRHDPAVLEDAQTLRLFLSPPREELYSRCAARFASMLTEGALAEVTALKNLDLDPSLPAMRAIGVRELLGVLDGKSSLEAASRIAIRNTRHYAKRQLTWARSNMMSWNWVEIEYMEKIDPLFVNFIRLLG